MKIVMVCQPWYNRGDESAHKALLRKLLSKIPDIQLKVIYVDEVTVELMKETGLKEDRVEYVILHGDKWYNRIWIMGLRLHFLWYLHPLIWKIRKFYRWADYVLCAPGGMNLGGFRDWNHLFWLELAKQCHKKIIYYGRSIGPFSESSRLDKRFKKWAVKTAHKLDFIAIRDKQSQRYADELGLSYIPTTDCAFLDSPSVPFPEEVEKQVGESPYMVFVPNYLLWHGSYKGFSREFIFRFYLGIIEIIASSTPNYKIVMLPQCFGNERSEFQDAPFFTELKEASKYANRIIVLNDRYSSDEQQSIIKNSKYLIGARYHSVVFSINQGTPFIALCYEHKMIGLLESLNKTNGIIDISKIFLSDDTITTTLQKIREMLPTLKEDKKMIDLAKEGAENCFELLLSTLNKDKKEV